MTEDQFLLLMTHFGAMLVGVFMVLFIRGELG